MSEPGVGPGAGPGPYPEEAAAPSAPVRPEDAPARPGPLGVTVAPTGNADVDAAIGRLADAGDLPTQSHIEVYEDVHQELRGALAALDENRS